MRATTITVLAIASMISIASALWTVSTGAAQSDSSLLVILPEDTRGELVDALRVELRGRSIDAVLVLAPISPDSDLTALELARAHGVHGVLWLAVADNPLAPPDAHFLQRSETSRSRAARLPAAADAIEPRLFALSLSELLDAPPEIESTVVAPTSSAGVEVAHAAPPATAADVPASVDDAAPSTRDEVDVALAPPRIFRPAFRPRLAIGAGAVGIDEPFHVAAALDLAMQLTPWLVFAGDITGWYAPGPDEAGAWVGLGLGALAQPLPGALTIVAEGGVAVFDDTLGVGGGLVARWEWSIDWVFRLGPRVGFHVWEPVVSGTSEPRDVGWMLFIGIDVLGVDLSLG